MRDIDWDKPLSDDDKLWLSQRMTPELQDKITANETRFGNEDGENSSFGNEGVEGGAAGENEAKFDDDYESWKLAELKAEAEGRDDLDVTGLKNRPDYIAALRTWDAANPDK